MIRISGLCKEYAGRRVVDKVSFDAPDGCVTGFIGPNGAGKSTTLRILLGLAEPTAGTALINTQRYRDLGVFPLRHVGAFLDTAGPVPERRGRDHLKWIALSNDLPISRVDEVLAEVGLADAGRKRVREYSMGMRQRLGIAAAILGNPGTLVLDEPLNGLDPEGIRWVRQFVRNRADQGGAVLVSSHFMKELESVADRVVLISAGHVVANGTLDKVIGGYASLEEAYFACTEEGALR